MALITISTSKLLTDLTNLPIQQQPEILQDYMPWSKNTNHLFVMGTENVRLFLNP